MKFISAGVSFEFEGKRYSAILEGDSMVVKSVTWMEDNPNALYPSVLPRILPVDHPAWVALENRLQGKPRPTP